MSFSATALLNHLERELPASASGKLCLAFSGGLDSTVLLRALATAERRYEVRAVHVDHQLHADSGKWRDHCARIAHECGVPFMSEQVSVPANAASGIEAAARVVRYAALKRCLAPRETLLTAQHADDQLETVLLALLRGAGVNGLSAMPACQPFGGGWHSRPLLHFTRAELHAWACEHQLRWLEDPSNDNGRFSRNYLRHEVIPAMRRRWPDAARSARRSAAHLGEAAELLASLAVADLAGAAVGSCLRVDALAGLDGPRRRNLLRYWLRTLGARAPSTQKLAALEHDMLRAQDDRTPWVTWDDFEVRRHRGLLYGHQQLMSCELANGALQWDLRGSLQLPAGLGQLRTENIAGEGMAADRLPERVRVSFRKGGESLRPAGHAHRRELKKLLQEIDVLPWWRDRIPLLHADRKLLAVGDLWIADSFAARAGEAGLRIVWDGKPDMRAAIP